jgi:hypothetical protein
VNAFAGPGESTSMPRRSIPAQAFVGQFLASFQEFPQRQKAASFNMDEVMQKMQESPGK